MRLKQSNMLSKKIGKVYNPPSELLLSASSGCCAAEADFVSKKVATWQLFKKKTGPGDLIWPF